MNSLDAILVRLRDRKYRLRVGVTELARRTGICRQTITLVLGGKNTPDLGTLDAIASALGFTLGLTLRPATVNKAAAPATVGAALA
jgi:transcriptional regulator with XRE-family HTH domain